MRFSILSTAALAFAQSAFAAPAQAEASALDVQLSQVDNTHIKAVVTNTGNQELKFVHLNFFKDNAPVQKVKVHKDGEIFRRR